MMPWAALAATAKTEGRDAPHSPPPGRTRKTEGRDAPGRQVARGECPSELLTRLRQLIVEGREGGGLARATLHVRKLVPLALRWPIAGERDVGRGNVGEGDELVSLADRGSNLGVKGQGGWPGGGWGVGVGSGGGG